jgi:hypothetical protein
VSGRLGEKREREKVGSRRWKRDKDEVGRMETL